ncbi:MAG: helix-turn-helix transcriptional regulator, partial [Bacteroidota bacterium]
MKHRREKITDELDLTNERRFRFLKIKDLPKMQWDAHSSYRYHVLKFYALILIENGEGVHYVDFEEYPCKSGTVLLIGKGQVHKFEQDSVLDGHILSFHDDFLTNILNTKETFRIIQVFNHSIFNSVVQLGEEEMLNISNKIDQIKREYLDTFDDFSSSIIASEVYTILSILIRKNARNNDVSLNIKHLDKFFALQDLMQENITQTTKVDDYAKSLGVSAKTLNTITKSIVSKQAKSYINEYHLLYIKRMLSDTSLSIKECAFQAGFDDIP